MPATERIPVAEIMRKYQEAKSAAGNPDAMAERVRIAAWLRTRGHTALATAITLGEHWYDSDDS